MIETCIPGSVHLLPNKRNCYAYQTAASPKRTVTDACHTVWDYNACQATASGECILSDACYTVRDYNACQATASEECVICNTSRPFTQLNACNRCVATNHPIIYIADAVFSLDNFAASGEYTPADACHAVRNSNACQTAKKEYTLADACHAIGNRDACQTDTSNECPIADACHTFRYCDTC